MGATHQDLQRDLSFVLQVVGQIDRRHAALTELTLDGVAAFEGPLFSPESDTTRT